jgi:periplasmic protein TonB
MIRRKQPEADLKLSYRKLFWGCVGISGLAHLLMFVVFPSFNVEAAATVEAPVIIQLEDIPETRQQRRPPPPPRPAVPIPTDNPDIPDDVTIEITDLDLDLDDLEPPPPLVEVVEELELEEEDEVVELWRVEQKPKVIKQGKVVYPEMASKAGIEGKVFVVVLVGKDGKVIEIVQVTGPTVFHEAAKTAAMDFVFSPAIQNDKPVKVQISLPFTFKLR